MICEICENEMNKEIVAHDQFDPYQGHTQYEELVWYCDDCDYCEEYVGEIEYDIYEDEY